MVMEKKKSLAMPAKNSFLKRNLGTIIGLIILVVIVSMSTPKFLTTSNQ